MPSLAAMVCVPPHIKKYHYALIHITAEEKVSHFLTYYAGFCCLYGYKYGPFTFLLVKTVLYIKYTKYLYYHKSWSREDINEKY